MTNRCLCHASAALIASMLALGSGSAAAAGSLDLGYAKRGIAVGGFGPDSTGAHGATLTPGGGVVVIGAATPARTDFRAAATRLTSTGVPDRHFGVAGRSLVALSGPDADLAVGVVRQADGKFVLAATADRRTNSQVVVYRLTARGRLDPSFGRGGKVLLSGFTGEGFTARSAEARAVLLQRDGRIVIVGSVYSDARRISGAIDYPERIGVARLTGSGRLDRTFGAGGRLVLDYGTEKITSPQAAALSPNGSIVVAGQVGTANLSRPTSLMLARVTPSGAPDESFGASGFATIAPTAGDRIAFARGVTVQRDGKPVVVGAQGTVVRTKWLTARFTSKGTLDAAFNGGVVLASVPTVGGSSAVAQSVTTDGSRLVVAGGIGLSGGRVGAIGRYLSDGRPDEAFGGRSFLVRSSRLGPITVVMRTSSPRRYFTAGQARQVPGAVGGNYAVARFRP